MLPTDLSDEKLIEIIRSKDQELYSEIIKRYNTKLSHYLRKFIYNTDELEDVLQSVFIKVYKNLHGFKTSKKFSSWIYRIAHNEAINHIKKRANQNVPLDETEIQIVDEKIDLTRDVDRGLLKEKISGCLGELKLKYREPLIFFYFEQKSYEEISDILRVPKSTIGTLILRGKKELKKLLKYSNSNKQN